MTLPFRFLSEIDKTLAEHDHFDFTVPLDQHYAFGHMETQAVNCAIANDSIKPQLFPNCIFAPNPSLLHHAPVIVSPACQIRTYDTMDIRNSITAEPQIIWLIAPNASHLSKICARFPDAQIYTIIMVSADAVVTTLQLLLKVHHKHGWANRYKIHSIDVGPTVSAALHSDTNATKTDHCVSAGLYTFIASKLRTKGDERHHSPISIFQPSPLSAVHTLLSKNLTASMPCPIQDFDDYLGAGIKARNYASGFSLKTHQCDSFVNCTKNVAMVDSALSLYEAVDDLPNEDAAICF